MMSIWYHDPNKIDFYEVFEKNVIFRRKPQTFPLLMFMF